MTRYVRFDGAPGFDVGRPAATEPYTGPVKVRELDDGHGNTRLETFSGWEPGDVVEFHRAMAEQHGRACDGKACDGDECAGDCFAEMFVDDMNRKFDRSEQTKAFSLLKTDPRKRSSDTPATANLVAPVQPASTGAQE